MISIIIPTYNSAKYIEIAIKSVLKQSYQNFELLIVDDGSIDNTKQIIKSINDHRIKYIYQENAGPSVARNNGISNAKGQFIAFLDADDEWYPEKLEKQRNILIANANVGFTFCAFDHYNYNNDFIKTQYYKKYRTHELFMKHLLTQMLDHIIYPSTVMLKKSILGNSTLFDEKIKTGEDWDLWLRLGLITEFKASNEVMAKRYKPLTSITSNLGLPDTKKNHLRVLQNFFNEDRKLPQIYKKLKKKAYSSLYFELAILCFTKNKQVFDFDIIMKYMHKSYSKDPIGFIVEYRKVKFFIRILVDRVLFQTLKKVY